MTSSAHPMQRTVRRPAPARDLAEPAPPSRLPTNKWLAVLVSGLFTIGAHAIASHGWDSTEWAELFTLFSGLALSYLTPNQPTAGGVPPARAARTRRRRR
jgi:hypothetical protein